MVIQMCRGQKNTCWVSSLTVWVLRIGYRLSGLVADTFTHWALCSLLVPDLGIAAFGDVTCAQKLERAAISCCMVYL